MTEAEWLRATDPQTMLRFLQGEAGDRKLRLFAVACCRRTWNLLNTDQNRMAVEGAERCADGLTSQQELAFARDATGHWRLGVRSERIESVSSDPKGEAVIASNRKRLPPIPAARIRVSWGAGGACLGSGPPGFDRPRT